MFIVNRQLGPKPLAQPVNNNHKEISPNPKKKNMYNTKSFYLFIKNHIKFIRHLPPHNERKRRTFLFSFMTAIFIVIFSLNLLWHIRHYT